MILHRWAATSGVWLTVACSLFIGIPLARARELTFEERVAAQKAIEQVYWNHRTWPEENPGGKPALAAVVPDGAIRAKVEDYLAKSNALERWWQRPITGEQLQSEMDRIATNTRDGEMLRELYRALGDDPFVIAETLSRQTLVDRLIRAWYASDTRFHGDAKARAEAAVAACRSVACMKSMGGSYREIVWRAQDLDDDEWRGRLEDMATRFESSADSLPMRRLSELEETTEGFNVTAVLARSKSEIVVGSVVWPKRTFGAWWDAERDAIGSTIEQPAMSYALTNTPSTACTVDSWTPTRSTVPDARTRPSAVWTGTEMIVWGGNNAVGQNSGGRYNPATDTWIATSRGPNVPAPRQESSAVWTGTEMIVWGGIVNSSGVSSSGGRYNPATDSWTVTSTGSNVPAPRFRHSAVWTGTEMIVWGGMTFSTYLNTGGRYDPSTDSWLATSVGPDVPEARSVHSVVWTGKLMIVWGGSRGAMRFNTGGLYDPSTDSWTTTSTDPGVPLGRDRHTAVWTGTEMIVWGGSAGFEWNTGGRYDPETDSWVATSTGSNVPPGRDSHTAVWTGSEMIIWGGLDEGATRLSSGGRYSPSTDSWTPTSAGANLPSARTSHTAVWTGTEMIVWGGLDTQAFNTGGRYKPSTDSWTPTATQSDVPTTRSLHAGVWTGTEMIVWGGQSNCCSYLGTGGRYLPVTDSWTATSSGSNVPSAREQHSAIWTGTEMIVWGGYDGVSFFDTGGRYNPSTDSWAETSTGPDLPAGRLRHTAVWTGTEMIVWGGYGGVYMNTGGRYEPSTDSWTATSTGTNLPSPRYRHSAVWTGKEMIVWGGLGISTVFNTGGIYDPRNDFWTTTSTGSRVPTFRYDHTAVWTGTRMIVWGGSNGVSNDGVKTGGLYAPSSDSWTVTSTGANVPVERMTHTTVWTGTEMIVWGGFNPSALYMNSGGRYNPSTDAWTATSTGPYVPSGRRDHLAVWTGTSMIVLGGTPWTASGGSYCACPSGRIVYRDADGDGYGNVAISIPSCDGSVPQGYSADATDCDDEAASVHPEASETCNGIDDDCNGVVDDNATGDDTDADGTPDGCDHCPSVFDPIQSDFDHDGEGDACDLNDGLIWQWREDKTSVSWQAEQGPTSWNVYIGDLDVLTQTGEYTQVPGSNSIADRHCAVIATVVGDPGTPASGKVAFSLVTGVTGGVEGSLGSSTSGPRANTHPCP